MKPLKKYWRLLVKKPLKSFWKIINGKKRTIALIYWTILVPSITVIWPDGYTTAFSMVFAKTVTIVGFALSAVGLGHAAIKSGSSKDGDGEN